MSSHCSECNKEIPFWDKEFCEETRKYGICAKCKYSWVR